ncbi:3-oxoacyl-ACP synthase [Persicobacter psychrovividus]|uniref:3-oxoacyl-ACP synthase n=1 Tax=Persicobacter psychrovividus TaxID=387638 RepID=A0ABN6L3W2_9BACT|nr:hypothetical protein PEPS_00330 [Persicobacter psychrovividus]
MINTKIALYHKCEAYVNDRIERSKADIQSAQEASNNETKSSAGDKYETARAMAQIEKEKALTQLSEAGKLRQALDMIIADKPMAIAELGSLVITTAGQFYMSISAGKLMLDGQVFFAISPASPLGQQLIGKQAGEQYQINGKQFSIKEIY